MGSPGRGRQYLCQGVTGRTDTLQHDLHCLGQRFLGTQEHTGLHPKSCLWERKLTSNLETWGQHRASHRRLETRALLCHPRLTVPHEES